VRSLRRLLEIEREHTAADSADSKSREQLERAADAAVPAPAPSGVSAAGRRAAIQYRATDVGPIGLAPPPCRCPPRVSRDFLLASGSLSPASCVKIAGPSLANKKSRTHLSEIDRQIEKFLLVQMFNQYRWLSSPGWPWRAGLPGKPHLGVLAGSFNPFRISARSP